MEGTTIKAPAVEDVWRWMPSTSGGEHWKALIGEAVQELEEAQCYPEELDLDELPHTFADSMSVYTVDRVRAVWDLDLWCNDAVADEVENLGGAGGAIRGDGTLDWVSACATYWYAARLLTMDAVIKAAQNPTRRCDRCERPHAWSELEPVVSAGFDLLCAPCATDVRKGNTE